MATSTEPNILVADGERSIRLMLETGLTLNGFRVTSVCTGRDALEAASTGEYDAVLSDIYMPEGGGPALVDTLRAAHPNLPIILMTTPGSPEVGVYHGDIDVIGKPFEISALVELLHRVLGAGRHAKSADTSEPPEHRLLADRPTMDELQRRYLQLILEEHEWNRRRAAAVLDLDRRTIQRLIARYQLNSAKQGEEEIT
jgi:DNA-binding NtrC family response regulator